MPFLIVFLVLLLAPPESFGHPGKTDKRGGHRCLKECAEWDLYYGEYHLHDKNGRPIRVAEKKKSRKVRKTAVAGPEPQDQPVTEPAATPVQLPAPRPAPAEEGTEETCIPSLSGGLLTLLLLWLFVRRRRAREQPGS